MLCFAVQDWPTHKKACRAKAAHEEKMSQLEKDGQLKQWVRRRIENGETPKWDNMTDRK